jgi:ubiquinone/menaquinone biosynthesis C-methylase UbiE
MGELKAAAYDFQMQLAGKRLASLRAGVIGGSSGRILELGVGTGQNLPFYPPGVRVIGIDPDPAFLRRAEARAARSAASVRLVVGAGEALPFPDGIFDEVVATLVFCTVPFPSVSLMEVRRVLRANGRLRFMEHIRSDDARWARIQDWATPVWQCIADG